MPTYHDRYFVSGLSFESFCHFRLNTVLLLFPFFPYIFYVFSFSAFIQPKKEITEVEKNGNVVIKYFNRGQLVRVSRLSLSPIYIPRIRTLIFVISLPILSLYYVCTLYVCLCHASFMSVTFLVAVTGGLGSFRHTIWIPELTPF